MKMEVNIVQIKKLSEDATIPTKATTCSAGYDFYSPIDCVVEPHTNKCVMTDIAIAWSDVRYYMQLVSRSSIAYKKNVTVEAGVIDFDYKQNIGVVLKNTTNVPFEIKKGDRIAQGIFIKISIDMVCIVEEFGPIDSFGFHPNHLLDGTERVGGFGSTGV
jgi:dUTP pyrophosphatase